MATPEFPEVWTAEEQARLVELWGDKSLSTRVIAKKMTEEFGREFTKNTVLGRAWRKGLKRREPRRHTDLPTNGTSMHLPVARPEPTCAWFNDALRRCGVPSKEGSSFCEEHHAVVTKPAPPLRIPANVDGRPGPYRKFSMEFARKVIG